MKRIVIGMFVFLLSGGIACAETPSETLSRLRQQYPTPIQTAAQVGDLLNRVAWQYRAQGMKLLGKKGGANCPIPNGELISCDYLVHAPSLTGHDVFRDAGPGGLTQPVDFTWGPGEEDLAEAIRNGSRTLVDPVMPDSSDGPTNPGGDDPGPTNPTSPSITQLIKDVNFLQGTVNQMREELGKHEAAEAEDRAASREFERRVGVEWGKVSKWAAIIGGSFLAGKFAWPQAEPVPAK